MSVELLTDLFGQCEHIRVQIAQSAEILRSVNTAFRHALASSGPLSGMERTIERHEIAMRQLNDVSEKVIGMRQALQIEMRDRTMVNHQLAAAEEQEIGARTAALHDKLTSLPNRALFNDRLEHGIAQAKRHRWTLAVMFFDLDGFKSINDTYGHQAGDIVLQTVAMRLKATMRQDDTISRFGGDEFVCVLTQLHEKSDIAMIAAKFLKAIHVPCDLQVGDVIACPRIDASIGVALFPKDGVSAAALIKRADEAMYGAKESKSGFAFAQ
jgi:diguanylate cyclase